MALDFLRDVGQEAVNPLVNLWNSVVFILPGILAAIIILVIGYIIALIVSHGIKHIVRVSRLDNWMIKKGLHNAIGGLTLSNVTGKLVKWWIFILFLVPAANVIKLGGLSSILGEFAIWFPNLIIAVIVILFGLVLAHIFAAAAGNAKKLKGIKWVSTLVYVATIVVFASISLRQIGVDVAFPETIILVILCGVMIAFAIGFGLGLRPHAEDIIKNWRRKHR
ncbi:MAG: hypothetical protein KJ600_00490 [Nanoarchaeota archaeon]|nr:hypothetical protein [Nanoarchaeota archaeon]MBU1103021.1 hypothetical protein [Nanoarchaeota archaeon]